MIRTILKKKMEPTKVGGDSLFERLLKNLNYRINS